MRTRAATWLSLAVAMATCGCAATTTDLFRDDLAGYERGSDAFPVWIADSGAWKVTAEGFEGADCEGHFIALGARTGRDEWSDYTLSLKLKVISRGGDWRDGPWIGFRYRNGGNAYTLGFYDRMTALHKASQGKSTSDEAELATSTTTIKDNEWHDLRITVDTTRITVVLDAQAIIQVSDDNANDSPPVRQGGIVLAARKHAGDEGTTRVVFKDVRVEAVRPVPSALAFTLADAQRRAPMRTDSIRLLDFLQTRRTRRWTRTPRKVLAFYYTWYGRPERHGRWIHWADVKPDEHDIATSTHYPAKGAYDSHDPAIIDHHIDLAKAHGVDAFIATWWGQGSFDDQAFRILLDRAKAKDFQVTVYWETVPVKGKARVRRAVADLVYVLESYGAHPAFLKVDGKPVIFIYGRVMGEVPLAEWPQILAAAQQRYGKDFLLIADGYREDYARLFDGLHVYNICGWVQGKKPDALADLSRRSFADAVALAKKHAKLSCITIIPGYDDTKIRTPGLNAERQDGETYRVLWEQAIAADPDWIVITSWNEWHEGSEIEPSWEHGDKYLQMTGRYAAEFKKSPYSKVPVPEPAAGVSAEKARALRELFGGKTIGILPGFGGPAVFWLADAGVGLKELTWQEVLDPACLNVKSFPVVLYAGFESYTRTVKEEGDVDRALLRYLGEGGLLVAMATGPFPFYYDEHGEAVVSARKLGFPIGGSDPPTGSRVAGWEAPPPGAAPRFRLDAKALPGLPGEVPFPGTGDLRWRPCAGALEGDVYLPLARLVDEKGHHYGDGIAYIEHRASEPKKGRNLYVWHRMADLLDPDALFFAVFRLAAEKMTK